MPHGEGRNAAAVLHVKTLAAAEVEIAVPDMQVAVADARARYAHQDFRSLRLWSAESDSLQRFPMLDDLIADHVFPASCSAWSMSQRMSSSDSMPTDILTMSGVTPALSWSSSLIC